MRKRILSIFLATIFVTESYSQVEGKLSENAITQEKKNELADTISKLVLKGYIFPATAEKMSAIIQDNQKKDKYNKAASPMEFARMIMQDLRDVSRDKHISIWYQGDANKQTASNTVAAIDTSYGISKTEILPGNIGYLKFNYFPSDTVEKARKKYGSVFTNFKSVNAIIIDLTDNFGGNPRMEVYLCSYFFSTTPRHLWDAYARTTDSTYFFYTQEKIDGMRHPDIPVYVLTGSGTFSAGEAFAYDLQAQKRATIIGETTAGGAHATAVFDIGNGFMMRLPITKITNAVTNSDWEGVGVKPDISCIQHEALDIAYIKAMKNAVSKTGVTSQKKALTKIVSDKEQQEKSFINANKKLKEYEGSYGIRKIIYSKGKLYFQRENEPLVPMLPSEKDLFVWGDGRTTTKFNRNAAGSIAGFDIIRPGQTIQVKKD